MPGLPVTFRVAPAKARAPAGEKRMSPSPPGMPAFAGMTGLFLPPPAGGTRAHSLRRGHWRGTGEERTADTEPHEARPGAALPSPAGFDVRADAAPAAASAQNVTPAQAGVPAGGACSRLSPSGIPAPAGMTAISAAALLLAACAAQDAAAVAPGPPGFLLRLWHGFIFPVAWVLSLFMPDVSVYAVPNNGGWYDFGYFLGIVVIGVGARKSHVVYRYRVVREGGGDA